MRASEVVISGIGQSAIGRRLDRSGLALTVDAVREALADAGLGLKDIDGLATFPGYRADAPAFSPVGALHLQDALGLDLDWYCGALEGSAQLGAIINAYAAIKAGLARHVLCFRTVKEGSGGASWKDSATARTERVRTDSEFQYIFPYHGISAANWLSVYAQRHFHLYGTTREHLAQIAVTSRRNAARNPKALFREPMSIADYMAARMVSTPLCLLDCDAPTDASTVIILSSAEAAADLRKPTVRIEAVGGGIRGRSAWDQAEMPEMAASGAARMLWSRTDLKPTDVDVALLYDGFSFLALTWLEAMGFCGKGEGGAFLEGGQRIAPDGELPLNPHGGQLSGGRTHGFGHVHEAVLQLRGEAGERQVGGDPQVAAVTNGGGPLAGALLLTRA